MQFSEFYAMRLEDQVEFNLKNNPGKSKSRASQSKSNYPVIFSKQDPEDHPLQRALDFQLENPDSYIFAKPYGQAGSGRNFFAQDVEGFVRMYCQLPPNERIHGKFFNLNFQLEE